MEINRMRQVAATLTALADAGVEADYLQYRGERVEVYAVGAEELRDTARKVKAVAGPLVKQQGDDGLELVTVQADVEVRIVALGGVCERVQVGTRTVSKPDPAAPLIDVEEPVYEVRCPDSVLADLEPEAVTA